MNIVVYAIGGNALSPPKLAESDPHHSNEQVLSNVISDILWLRNEGYKVVMTHGNGPQVGALMMDALPTEQKTLDQWVAVTQDTIGHELSQPLEEALASSSSSMQSLVMIVKTRVLVDAADPSFEYPTKPIGPILTETDVTTRDWDIANTLHGPRRVVASPSPLRIIEIDTIRNLVGENGSNHVVICCGGGGIPVKSTENGLEGATAVIDKDLASALLATELGAHALIIATEADAVYRDFGLSTAERIIEMNADEALKKVENKEFPPGSMGPKVQACAKAAEKGILSFICQSGQIEDVLNTHSGTRFKI